MDANYYIQEPPAVSAGKADAQRAASADVTAADVTTAYLTPDGTPGKPPPQTAEQFLTSQGYPNSAQIAGLQYAQGQNVGVLFQEDPYSGYGITPAPSESAQPAIGGQPIQAMGGQPMQAALGHIPQGLKRPEGPKGDPEARARAAEKKLKEVDAQLGKVLKEKAALEKDLAKEKKDRALFQELDAKRAQERESVAAWESHWRVQEKALKAAVEESRRKNQAMQAKLGGLEARLKAAFDEIEKLRGAAVAAGERAGRLERELEEERQAYRELEEDKAADAQMITEGEAAGVEWVQEAVRLRRELDAEKKARVMWQNMTGKLARDLNDEKARRARELSAQRAEFARGANGQWLVRVEELERELKRAGEEAAAAHEADQAKLAEAQTELAAEKRQKQSWQQIAERIGKESKEGRKEVEVIQKRLQEALRSSKPPPVPAPSPPPPARRGSRSSVRGSPAPEMGGSDVEDLEGRKGKRERLETDDEATDDDEPVPGGEARGAKVPPRKRLKSLADLGKDSPKKVWKSRRARGTKKGDQAEGGQQGEVAEKGGAAEGSEEGEGAEAR